MHSESTPVEEWRPVVGYEGRYEVSSLGRVRSLVSRYGPRQAPRPVAGWLDYHGYRSVLLRKDGHRSPRYVAHLVAEAFIGPRPPGHQVNHLDGLPLHNSAANLEYVTPRDNMRHAARSGLLPNKKGEAHHLAKLTDEAVRAIRAKAPSLPPATGRRGGTRDAAIEALAVEYGVTAGTIRNVIAGRCWPHVT